MRARSATSPARRGRTAALLAGVTLAGAGPLTGAAVGAGAVEGNLYPRPPAGAVASAPFAAAVTGSTHVISAPAEHIGEGQKWRAHWACEIPGTELASLKWTARRGQGPSSLEAEARAGGTRVWGQGDAAMPDDTDGPFEVALPPGTCTASLALRQAVAMRQHARRYVIGTPRAVVRDVTPPVVSGVQVPTGWVGNTAEIGWSVADNMGSEGIAAQRILIAGHEVWSGHPGQGAHRVAPPLGGIPEGVHPVVVAAEGDGTPPGSAAGPALHVDRTPPLVAARGVQQDPFRGADFRFAAADALSGVRAIHVEVNAALDGSRSGPWVEVGTTSGDGEALKNVDLAAFPQGVHAWRVRAVDDAGNVGVAEGSAPVIVDLVPPSVVMAPLPRVPLSVLPLTLVVGDNLQRLVGLGPTVVSVNTAPDGHRTGRWVPLKTLKLAPGRHAETVPITGVADGRHAVMVTVHNAGAAGGQLVGAAYGEAIVDATPPRLEPPSFAPAGPDEFKVSWIADDASSGVVSAAVQWRDGETWRTLDRRPVEDGAHTITVDANRLPGQAPLRLVVVDGAGNIAVAAASLDRAGPAIAELALRGGRRLTWRQSDEASGFGACETSVQINGPGTDNQWRELLAERLGAGPQSVRLPIEGLPPGAYRVRVAACDAAGNVAHATMEGGVRIRVDGPLGAGSTAVDPYGRLADARLTLRAAGARLERSGRRDVLVRSIRFGEALTVTGRLRTATGAAVGRTEIEAREGGGRVIGRGRTTADGRFRLSVRPEAGGPIRVGVPAGDGLFPHRPGTQLRVGVAPRVELSASNLHPAAGERVVFAGRLLPAPRRVGVPSKGIVLEWLDPQRQAWRPVVNTRTRADGSFQIPWEFGLGGLAIPVRVRVAEEVGWPLLPATSEQVTVTVG